MPPPRISAAATAVQRQLHHVTVAFSSSISRPRLILPLLSHTSHTQQQHHRSFAMSSPSASPASKPTVSFAHGTDAARTQPEVDTLLANAWVLDDTGAALEKTFYFKTYTKAVDFTNLVAIHAKAAAHHPTLTLAFGRVHVRWTTHQPLGLSAKDTALARCCDAQAAVTGAVPREQGGKCAPSPSTSPVS